MAKRFPQDRVEEIAASSPAASLASEGVSIRRISPKDYGVERRPVPWNSRCKADLYGKPGSAMFIGEAFDFRVIHVKHSITGDIPPNQKERRRINSIFGSDGMLPTHLFSSWNSAMAACLMSEMTGLMREEMASPQNT